MSNDLRNSLDRLFNSYKIYEDNVRYALVYDSIKELYDTLDDDTQEQLKLMLLEEGIKRIAGIWQKIKIML